MVLTYNVWFEETVALAERMAAIGRILAAKDPDVVCFQEVTPNILRIFQASRWWHRYTSVVDRARHPVPYYTLLLVRSTLPFHSSKEKPFNNSQMGRSLLFAQVAACGLQIKVGTSHLESPCPPFKGESMYGKQRRLQLSSAIEALTPPPPPDEGPEGGAGGGRGGRGGATGMPAPARTPSSQAT